MQDRIPRRSDASIDAADQAAAAWFFAGARAAVSLPLVVLMAAFVGFASLARESGFPLVEALFMTLTIWALPSMVVLVGAVTSGAGVVAAFIAVTLSAVRLMPMTVALAPELRGPRTRRLTLYVLSHFVAVTAWVMAFQLLPAVPRSGRTGFFAGIAAVLMVANLAVVAVVYWLARDLPPSLEAGLLLITPVYFLTSLWGSAREDASRLALGLGLVLGPAFRLVAPGFELLAAGFLGGGLACAWHWTRRRKANS